MAAASSTTASAAAEHEQPAPDSIFEPAFEALVLFLDLGLRHFWPDGSAQDRGWAIGAATTANINWLSSIRGLRGAAFARWWACVAFEAPKTVRDTTTPLTTKDAKDLRNFVYWARLCQKHREGIAKVVFAASAAEQGVPGSFPSWRGGVELSEEHKTE